MKTVITVVALLVALVSSAAADDEIEIAPEHQERVQKAGMALVFAHGCDQSLDDPEFMERATSNFAEALRRSGVPEYHRIARDTVRKMKETPQKPDDAPFTLFNPTMCGQVRSSVFSEPTAP